ncbi:MAG: ATP-grasp domain-containing protein [Treponema sp.]|jgi:biotin carboxylase|nr:ATP-grasp domain-containing protein [Treponema sp.]
MSGKQRILILGAGVMQGPALTIAKEMGLETVAADGDPCAACVSLADRFENVDLKDKEGIEALARSLAENGGLAGVMTAGTDFSAAVAWTAERLGLPGISWETALDASDKERMRRRFKAAGVPSPEFIIISEPPSKNSGFSLPFSWPAVVKPVDNMGSRGCRRVDNAGELETAAAEAFTFSRSGRVIVEEYMDGPEFSVDALVYQGEITICGLADRHIFFPPYFIEMGHTMPSSIDTSSACALLEAFKAGVRALGIGNGAAKGDLKLTSKGPMIGEIAARLSGGYMSGWTYPYASGVLPTRGAIQIAIGQKPGGLEPKKNWTCAERAFISIPGRVRSVSGLDKARSVPAFKDLFMRIREGSLVAFPENNVTKCGNIISAAPGRAEAAASAEAAARSILIRLVAPDNATAAFLAPRGAEQGSGFPPDAFVLDARLRGLLDALPDTAAESGTEPALVPFPEFTGSGLTDWAGRSVLESLAAVRLLTGLSLPSGDRGGVLGRPFWAALVRGGYQGAVYYLDSLGIGKQ